MQKSFLLSFFILSLLISFIHSDDDIKNKNSRGKCLFMITDSLAYNFHYLKNGKNENK